MVAVAECRGTAATPEAAAIILVHCKILRRFGAEETEFKDIDIVWHPRSHAGRLNERRSRQVPWRASCDRRLTLT